MDAGPNATAEPEVRLTAILAVLALAADLGQGQPADYSLRACLLALRIAEAAGAGVADQRDVFDMALLRYIGCTGHAHEVSVVFGDEIAFRARSATLDFNRTAEVVLELLRQAGKGRPPLTRAVMAGGALAAGRKGARGNYQASCEVGQLLVARLGIRDSVRDALWHAFERWDGRGFPHGIGGDGVALASRVVTLAQDVEVFHRVGGVDAAVRIARERRGGIYDPALVDCFCAGAPAWCAELDEGSPWEKVLAAEPGPRPVLAGSALDGALEVVADFADLKSPFTMGHSRGVAELAAEAVARRGGTDDQARTVRRAGWLHDLGRTSVPNSVWDKPGRLNDGEWERVRLHSYHGERLVTRLPLGEAAQLAPLHHERVDGTGYHRGVAGAGLSFGARVLAAADAYHAMTEARPHRAALTPEDAAAQLRADAEGGRLDREATAAVLAAAGHRPARRRAAWPGGLSDREVEVLRLVTRGLTAKQAARALSISPKTAAHHVQHAYTKLGVSTRGAAALFMLQNGLMRPD